MWPVTFETLQILPSVFSFLRMISSIVLTCFAYINFIFIAVLLRMNYFSKMILFVSAKILSYVCILMYSVYELISFINSLNLTLLGHRQ